MLFKSERRRANDAEQGRDAAIHISNGLSAEIHKYRNKQGDTVLSVKSVVIPKSQVKSLLGQNKLGWLKKFDGLTSSNLVSGESFTIQAETASIPKDTVYLPCKDSIAASRYDYHDEWNDIHAVVIGKPIFEIKDKYYAVLEMKRPKHWFIKFQWRKREPILEITNSNKRIKIDSVVSIIVK